MRGELHDCGRHRGEDPDFRLAAAFYAAKRIAKPGYIEAGELVGVAWEAAVATREPRFVWRRAFWAAIGAARKHFRQNGAQRPQGSLAGARAHGKDPAAEVERLDFMEWVVSIPAHPRQRQAIRLEFAEGLSPGEAADAMGISYQALWELRCRALDAIRWRMKQPAALRRSGDGQ